MATWLKQSTAVDLPIGPFLDSGDGNTQETSLTITQPDIRLKKNGGNWAQKSAAQTLSHEEAGWYEVSLSTTDTDTLGHLVLAVHESGALPVWREFMVVAANVYDSMIGGGDTLDVQVTGIGANVITATAINNDAITAAKVAADVTTEIQSGLATASALSTVAGYVDTEVAAILSAVNALPAASDVAEAVMESTIDVSDDVTPPPAATLRRRLRQMFNKVGL